MKSYELESIVQENGSLVLPNDMKNLRNHRVKKIVIDIDAPYENPTHQLEESTNRYSLLQEADLDIDTIYQQRNIPCGGTLL